MASAHRCHVDVNDPRLVGAAEAPPVTADPLIGFCTSFSVKIIFIFLVALCCGNNSVIWRTRQHMAAVYDQQPPLRGDWDMLMEQ